MKESGKVVAAASKIPATASTMWSRLSRQTWEKSGQCHESQKANCSSRRSAGRLQRGKDRKLESGIGEARKERKGARDA